MEFLFVGDLDGFLDQLGGFVLAQHVHLCLLLRLGAIESACRHYQQQQECYPTHGLFCFFFA